MAADVISITMDWKQAARLIAVALENGTDEGKRLAREELLRMADVADTAKELQDDLAAVQDELASVRFAMEHLA